MEKYDDGSDSKAEWKCVNSYFLIGCSLGTLQSIAKLAFIMNLEKQFRVVQNF